ncbi:uncharacterized protein LOC112638747 [Camponotus floridanus]|uniref:uncharacterized protein LOC112638747 n=1 Tax=Camponotus floridanus TaxID=104421 RepID=UPI000DC67D06|nr:uncharacterized protein LOC112638747 [Camponotus floridanus]
MFPSQSLSKIDKATMVSPRRIYNSPEKCRFRRRIKFLEAEHAKKMRNVHQQIRRYSDQVLTLKSILNKLKNNKLLNETQAEMIHLLGGSTGMCRISGNYPVSGLSGLAGYRNKILYLKLAPLPII